MTSESAFYKRFAKVLDPNLASTFLRDTGRQFFTNLLSFPFFSIKVITACFCEFDSLLYSKAWFRLSTTNFRNKDQKAKKNPTVKPSFPGDLIFLEGLQYIVAFIIRKDTLANVPLLLR